jgi:hypothetical protein
MTRSSAHHQFQFARVPSRVAKAARRSPSSLLRRAAPSFIVNDQVQMGTDTALGRRWGMCRLAPALGGTGRFGGLGCFTRRPVARRGGDIDLLLRTGRGLSRFRPLFGAAERRDGNRALASIVQCRRQSAFQGLTQRLEAHFKLHGSNAVETSDGARGSVPVQTGKLPFQRGGLPHVGRS